MQSAKRTANDKTPLRRQKSKGVVIGCSFCVLHHHGIPPSRPQLKSHSTKKQMKIINEITSVKEVLSFDWLGENVFKTTYVQEKKRIGSSIRGVKNQFSRKSNSEESIQNSNLVTKKIDFLNKRIPIEYP